MEGLPLKYIATVLVAAMVIAAVYAVVSEWVDISVRGGNGLVNTTGGGIDTQNKKLCESQGGIWDGATKSCGYS